MSSTRQLYQLQQIDDEIVEKKKRLRDVLRAQKGSEELEAAQAAREETEARLIEARTRQKDMELELGQLNAQARRSEKRLYSGEVTNTKELSDLQLSLASLGRRREMLEEKILEMMFVVEEAEEEDEAAAATLQQAEEDWADQKAALAAEQNELALRLNELLDARKEHVAPIDRQLLNRYEETSRRRGGVAVAALQNGLCQACRVRVPGIMGQAARDGEVVECANCGRILYAP